MLGCNRDRPDARCEKQDSNESRGTQLCSGDPQGCRATSDGDNATQGKSGEDETNTAAGQPRETFNHERDRYVGGTPDEVHNDECRPDAVGSRGTQGLARTYTC